RRRAGCYVHPTPSLAPESTPAEESRNLPCPESLPHKMRQIPTLPPSRPRRSCTRCRNFWRIGRHSTAHNPHVSFHMDSENSKEKGRNAPGLRSGRNGGGSDSSK